MADFPASRQQPANRTGPFQPAACAMACLWPLATAASAAAAASATPSHPLQGVSSFAALIAGTLAILSLYLWQRRRVAEQHAAELSSLNQALLRSEDALRHSEERFRRAFEDGPVGIVFATPNAQIIRANRAFCRLLGYSEPELQGFALMDLAFPDDTRRHFENVLRLFAGESPQYEHEMRFVRRDKEILWAKVTTSLLTDPDKRPLCEVSIFEDITARKRSEHVLRQSEERFSKAFHSSPVPIAITTLAEGRFIDANEAFLHLTGHTRDQLVGCTTTNLGLWPDTVAYQQTLQRLSHQGSIRDAEIRVRIRCGELRQCLASMEQIDLGTDRCLLAILHDITDRSRAIEALRQSEERFQLIARATNDTVWDWDILKDRVWWNDGIRTVFGHAGGSSDSPASTWDEHIHTEDRHRVLQSMQQVIDGTDKFWSAEYRFRRADGSFAEVLDRAYVLRDTSERAFRMIGAIMDITERKRFLIELAMARDAAVEALRLKSEFLANISHEVRTPLNGIVGMTVLLQDTTLSHEQRSYVDTIQSSTDALLTIINDILDFSKIEAGKVHLEVLNFDLRNTLDTSIEILADRAQGKHIELITLVEPDVPDRLRGDPGRLRQIITNLLVNAIKFTEEGEVLLHVNRSSETDTHVVLMFTVRDTGIGIPQQALPYLFQAFSQVDGSTTRKHGGTGLGLTISKQLVELLGGQIGVESTLGQGSTFWFTVRLEKQTAVPSELAPHQPSFAGSRVLVADGNESSLRMLLAATASLHIEAVPARSSQEAVRLLQDAATAGHPFRLAIIDTGLSRNDSPSFAQDLHRHPLLTDLRLILVSPRGAATDTALLRASGIGALLIKPLRQRLLIDSIVRLLTPEAQHETRFWLDRRPLQRAAAAAWSVGARHARILVAEDNPINQRVAMAILEKLGYKAQAVSTGPEVLRALDAVPFDIILMDCQLPEIDGFETTREIRRRESRPGCPPNHIYIIAMTAMAQPGARQRCLDAGMDDYLSKPVRLEALTEVLRKGMERLPSLPSPLADSTPHPSIPSDATSTSNPTPSTIDNAALNELSALATPDRPDPVGEMCAMFLRQAPAGLREIELAIVRYEASEVERAAHSLKGSASTMGAHTLARLCSEIEDAAHKGALQIASNLLTRVRVEFSKVRDELQSLPPHRN